MKITPQGASSPIVLVDSTVGDFDPIPAGASKQRFGSFSVEGGPTSVWPRGGDQPFFAPQVILIDQATDAAAQAIWDQLDAAIRDPEQQPMQVDWSDIRTTPFDGLYWISDLTAPELSTDFAGRIRCSMTMRLAEEADGAGGGLGVQHNGALVGLLSTGGVTVG